jgi:hypothetical protein
VAVTDKTKPLEGRCNARLGGGRYCHSRPKAGTTRCAIHGGTQQRWALRHKRIAAAAQDEIDAALTDPDLLDVRRPIALAEAIVQNTTIVASDEEIRAAARRRILQRMSPAQIRALGSIGAIEALEPTEADCDEIRLERHERSMRLVGMYALRQADAVKQIEWSRVIRESALPLLSEFGLRLTRTLRKYLPDDIVTRAMDDARKDMLTVIGELSRRKDEHA